MDCATMGGPKEQCVSLQITQLMLHKFTVPVYENVDQREISHRDSLDSFMSLCFYINSRCYTPSFMASLLMGTQIGGMDLRPRDKATERPVRYMFRSRGFPWISSEITRTIFFDLPIWDSNSSSFSCRSFSSQREPTVVGSKMFQFDDVIMKHIFLAKFLRLTIISNTRYSDVACHGVSITNNATVCQTKHQSCTSFVLLWRESTGDHTFTKDQ